MVKEKLNHSLFLTLTRYKFYRFENFNNLKQEVDMKRLHRIIISVMIGAFVLTGRVQAQEKFVVDPAHTHIGFSVTHMVITKVHGKFDEYEAVFYLDRENIANSRAEARIKVTSINTENQKRDDHLRSKDFFDAEKYPEITFRTTRIEKTDDGYVAIGPLTIKGVTREIRLPFVLNGPITDPWGNERFGIEAEVKINRQDFGIKWNKTMDNGGLVVGNTVTLRIHAEFIKAKETTSR